MKLRQPILITITVFILAMLTACGGGGGGGGGGSGGDGATPTAPVAPTVSLDYGVKQVQFSWTAVSGATHYKLFENQDGVSGYTQVGGDIVTISVFHNIALYQRLNARYIIEACNSIGCTGSTPQSLAANLIPAIGYVKASNTGAGDNFGYAIAISADGNTLAVGSPLEDSNATGISGEQGNDLASESGAVYVYTRSGSTWIQQAYVKASNTGAGDKFGVALALSADGNTLAVGASEEASNATGIGGDQGVNSAAYSGAAYVYTRSGSIWSQQAYVKASNTGAYGNFGIALTLSADGNTLVVGAPGEASGATGIGGYQLDDSAPASGAVYVYTRSGSTWTQQAYMKASNTGAGDSFGYALALSADGNTLAVGAYGEDSNATGIGGYQLDNTATESGAAYVYTRSGSSWTQQAYVKASNTQTDDFFGLALTLSADGNTLAVGAYAENSSATGIGGNQLDNSAAYSGAAYVYTRSGIIWTQQAYVKASNTDVNDYFGYSLVLSADGNMLVVGAPGEASNAIGIGGNQGDDSAAGSGAAYVFNRSGGTWSQQAYVKASNSGAGDGLGNSLALSADGNTLAVGAFYEDSNAFGISGDQVNNSVTDSGAVYLY